MWSRLRSHRPSHTTVVAYLSLFLVLTGGSAVALTGSNTVFSDDITNNQVRSEDVRNDDLSGGGLASRDIRPDALTGSDVRALTGGDVNDNSLTGNDVTGLTGADVNDNSLTGNDVRDLTGEDVGDGSLRGRDIAKTETRVTLDMGTIGANSCYAIGVPGVTAGRNDHVVVTPDYDTTAVGVAFTAQVNASSVVLHGCNHKTTSAAEGNVTVNVLVIDPN